MHLPTTPGFTAAALGLTLLLALPGSSAAQLRFAPVISEGMVMQRHATVPVWGLADGGDTVKVTFDGQTYTAIPDARGQWTVKLPPRAAGGPYEMTVAGKQERRQIRNIFVGDVWLCAGQSNMAWPVGMPQAPDARDLQIRHFQASPPYMPAKPTKGPWTGSWAVADSAHTGDFTAVGYFFARELRKSVDVPIGLINVAVGGSFISEWMSPEAPGSDGAEAVGKLSAERGPTRLYTMLIDPLLSYPIKGILWYQGESHTGPGDDLKYRELFSALIQDWRRAWGLGDFPFLFVQLPNFGPADTIPAPSSSWAIVRESQSSALRLPNTAQAVTIDLGEDAPGRPAGGHPGNKQPFGARLALAARKVVYGEKLEYSGPQYRRHTFQGGRAVLEFDHVGRGLMIGRQGGQLGGFVIAGADRQFVWATARIEGDRVVVWSKDVPQPVAVRYAWGDNPSRANLYNRAGLPTAPFRTDEWLERVP